MNSKCSLLPCAANWTKGFHKGENLLVTLTLSAMVLLPLAEIFLRKFFHTGISGVNSIIQHLVLIVGMLGGAIAARENRLLSLSTVISYLNDSWKIKVRIFSGAFGAAICVFLCVAGVQYALSSIGSGKIIAYGIPVWTVQFILPIGFAIIATRIINYSSNTYKRKLITVFLAGTIILVSIMAPFDPKYYVLPAMGILFFATTFGTPIFVVLGGAALILFWSSGSTLASVSLDHYRMVVNPSLPAIPLFTMAGYFLAEGGASKRLIAVFQAVVGGIRGGPAWVTVLVCAFFTCFTGASGVTILALGGLLMPVLLAAKYSEKDALGLLTGAGSLGLLFPPCLPLILYAIIASQIEGSVTIKEMFLGGIGPGILLVSLTAWWGYLRQPKEAVQSKRIDLKKARRAMWTAKWELLLPVVAIVTLFGGFATPVEAAAVTAFYAFFIETFVYRDLHLFKDIPRVVTECGLLVGGILLILGVAMGFNNFLIDAHVPERAVEWITTAVQSKWMFLILLNIFLLVVGCLLDIYSAIIVVVPLIVPLGLAYNISPVHLGIIFLANLELGYLTPPVGMNLFLASYRFNKPLPTVYRAVLPMLGVLLVGVLLVTYIPALTLTIPGWFK